MAKKENETRTSIDELNESLSGIEKKVEENKEKATERLAGLRTYIASVINKE